MSRWTLRNGKRMKEKNLQDYNRFEFLWFKVWFKHKFAIITHAAAVEEAMV